MGALEPSDGGGPGPLPAIVGGVFAALVLFWLAGIVAGTIVFIVRVAVWVAVVVVALWVWSKFKRD